MDVIFKNIEDLKPAEYNPRKDLKTGDAGYEAIKNSLESFGYIEPIIVNRLTGVIVGGHQRYKVLKDLGFKEVQVVEVELSEEQEKACNIALNSAQGDWDLTKLEALLEELDLAGLDMDLYLTDDFFNEDKSKNTKDEKEAQEDNYSIPDVDTTEPITRTGDVWQLGRHRLICGDSLNPETYKLLLGGLKADLVFTDPPYGMKKEKDGVSNDNLNYDDLLEFNKVWIPLTFNSLKSNGSWYCWGIDEPLMDVYSNILKPMIKENKITFRNLITWKKENANPTMLFNGACSSNNRSYYTNEKCLFVMCGVQGFNNNADNYYEGWESIRLYLVNEAEKVGLTPSLLKEICGVGMWGHWFTKSQFTLIPEEHYLKLQDYYKTDGFKRDYDGFKRDYDAIKQDYDAIKQDYDAIKQDWYSTRAYFDGSATQCIDIWVEDVTSGVEKKETGGHATPKPIALCSRAIKSSSREGDIVLDAFGGSGSTLIACEQLGRTCYMVELEPKWCDVIINRWEKLTGLKAEKIN